MSWTSFYSSRMTQESRAKFEQKYSPFLSSLKEQIKSSEKVLEVGCGTGLVTKLVKIPNKTFSVLDEDGSMLDLTRHNLGKDIERIWFNLINPFTGNFDVIHSHGVLEHFHPDKIREVVGRMKERCKSMVHYVPTDKYSYQSYGDELLLPSETWKSLVNPTKTIEFNSGRDLILIWERRK